MSELDEIRQKRMEALMQQQQESFKEQVQLQRQVEMLEMIAKQKMTKEAISRYGNLKAAHPEKAIQIIAILAQAIQQGQITEQITDEKLKSMLMQLEPPKKEFKITKK
ncbi:MAG: hypothetical protein KKA79_10605 [Nanoarchaeota archaeon]|nr:hypothetical protein [Nanoarchaeota archaeon]MCG2718099.1 hypothetical protein [Nanoarchaeota archaeon]